MKFLRKIFIGIFLINFLTSNISLAEQNQDKYINPTKAEYVDVMLDKEVFYSLNKQYNIMTSDGYLLLLNEIKEYCDGLSSFLTVVITNLQNKNNINLNTKEEVKNTFLESISKNISENAPNLWEANTICQYKLTKLNSSEIYNKDSKVLRLLLKVIKYKEISQINEEASYLIDLAK